MTPSERAPSERGVIFTAESVRAILAGRKTQTRRVSPWFGRDATKVSLARESGKWCSWSADGHLLDVDILCPYGAPGDRLWVKETFCLGDDIAGDGQLRGHFPIYRADWKDKNEPRWKSPLFLPREYARIVLEVVSVRVERVQDISETDATAEGVDYYEPGFAYSDPTVRFEKAWDSINGKRAPWASNPWVWVVEFRRTTP